MGKLDGQDISYSVTGNPSQVWLKVDVSCEYESVGEGKISLADIIKNH
jgi:hypothetical protein